ncbi:MULTISPECIES: beta-galactosidase [Streptomyces]|uniref:Beta-galactosidase n=1 Tax=Streptomyces caniscabiei TaxID=2746961 RepID=A0ABU4MND7_9ACTN|nr:MULTISPECIES: beta-galactosidase [Streptomyces]MBE4734433.1 beta-galactosidase [Streptomyces caniscabiei]MBE4755304.1 beta-galactosidase [Streptomyces caniscabiei]MBE4771384.1 beta-galactosidase [Streptomyces caniscabiei]MBE4783411.1 beta-galactosidase [Streptomyces caniscabiei]MBE4792715.1 beta-galactosidase [Streptomyces caniscabiei]
MARPHRVRLRGPGEPQRRGRLPFADAPGVPDPIEVGSRLLTRGGRPWFPVSGEFHYSRYPAGEWEEELLKMKAGGVTVVAAYVIWIHHEETEGRVRFDGDRDLRRFAELCARHGLDFVPRIGPWVHAEVRGGGLPDWVLARTDAPRTDDPAYLAPVRRWYAAIAEQLRGLGRAEGGPIVAIQIENELYDQPDHLLTLKRMAQEAGLSAPLWTSTAWGGVRLPPDELLPLYGGYTDAFWTEADGGWPDTCRKHFFFTHQRDDEGIGADLRPTAAYGGDAEELSGRFPWATCELGGGMAVAYHRRPRVDAADVGALGLTKIGCGSVWQGYYMYHGGTNPPGDLTPLQESHATGYPNDLPRLTYDFQAPLGEYGQYRPSYDELRLQHLLLADFGGLIAPMESVLPELLPTGQDDRETLRWAVRADDRSGFLFVNNHQPHEPLPDRPGTSFEVEFPGDGPVLSLPSAPVTIPQGAYFCWPLRLEVAGLRLDWATAQPLCTVDDGRGRTILVLTATDGIAPELALDLRTVTTVSAPSDAEVTTTGDRALVTALRPGTDALVEVDTADGHRVGLLVLDAATARGAYRGPAWGAERLILSADGGVVFDAHADEVRIHSAADAPSLAVLPAPGRAPVVTGATVKETEDGVFVRYTLVAEDDDVRPGDGGGSGGVLPVTLARPAGEAPPVTTGAMGRASVPADGYFDAAAAEYGVALPADPPPGTLLRLHWTGDVARAYVGERLVADQFFSGRVWEIGLDRLPAGELRVRVLPLAAGAPVYVPGRVDDAAIPAELRRAECATVRSWPLRPG